VDSITFGRSSSDFGGLRVMADVKDFEFVLGFVDLIVDEEWGVQELAYEQSSNSVRMDS
jgi:hypothetical protein